MSVVHYKFKNNLEYKTISFDGLSISLGDFKQAILSQNKARSGEFDLEVTNAQSKEAYSDESTQIPKNASVIIRRIPVGPKATALTATERPQSPADASKPTGDQTDGETPVIPLSKLNKVADLASANASEEDKIAAMMNQAGENWDPTMYAKPKGRQFNTAPRFPPPPHYMCFRCRKPGHWIQNCPKNNDPNYDLKIRRTTGIPKSFLRLADKPTQKGALLIPDTGQYAVPIVDHNAYEQAAIRKRKDAQASGVVENEKPIPPEYFCPICKKIMNNAVVVPCCGDSFCDTCIEKYLLEHDHVCPSCQTEDVAPASIVINKHLRQAIIKIKSSGFDGGSALSAVSSPAAHRDGDTPERTAPEQCSTVEAAPSPGPVSDTAVASPSPATEVSKPAAEAAPSTMAPAMSVPQPTPTVAQAPTPVVPQPTILDPRLQRPEGMMAPMPVTLAPVHRPAYVMSASPVVHPYHAHHALIHPTHPTVPSINPYAHLPHPALVPTRHAPLPFTNLEPGVMMNEEEFYRAKLKLQESRDRRKRRAGNDDDRKTRKKDRSRSRRERRESPSSRRTSPEASRRAPKDRSRRRGRSRSWTPGSSSRSSWSHSWSKSPSRSYSRSKSRTPVNWDRSRSPSGEKKARGLEEKKRRTKDSQDAKKKSKTNIDETSEKRKVTKSIDVKKDVLKKGSDTLKKSNVDSESGEKLNVKTESKDVEIEKPSESRKDSKNIVNKPDVDKSEKRSAKIDELRTEAKKDLKKAAKVESDSRTVEKEQNIKKLREAEKIQMKKSSTSYSATKEQAGAKKSHELIKKDVKTGTKKENIQLKEKEIKTETRKKSADDVVKKKSDVQNIDTSVQRVVKLGKKFEGSTKSSERSVKSSESLTKNSDVRNVLHKSTAKTGLKNAQNFEKPSERDLAQKRSGSKGNEVKAKNADDAKTKQSRDDRSRKILVEEKKSRRRTEESQASIAEVERRNRSSKDKDLREEILGKQKTTRTVVEKTRDKTSTTRNSSERQEGRKASKENKLNVQKTLRDIKKEDILRSSESRTSLREKNYSVGKIKHKNDELNRLDSEKSSRKRNEKRRCSDSEDDVKTTKKRGSKRRKSEVSDDERRVSRKRTKDEDESDGNSEKTHRKKKKKRSSMHDDDRKHKRRKHKRKHRKHKHKRKSKRKERKKSESESEESDEEEERHVSKHEQESGESSDTAQSESEVEQESGNEVEVLESGSESEENQSEMSGGSLHAVKGSSGNEFISGNDEMHFGNDASNDDVMVEEDADNKVEAVRGIDDDDEEEEELDYDEEDETVIEVVNEGDQAIDSDEEEQEDNEGDDEVDVDSEGEEEMEEDNEGVEEDSEGVEEDIGAEEDVEEESDGEEVGEIEQEIEEVDEEEINDVEEETDGENEAEEKNVDEEGRDENAGSEEETDGESEEENVEVEEIVEIELEGSELIRSDDSGNEELLLIDDDHDDEGGKKDPDESLLDNDVPEQPTEKTESAVESNYVVKDVGNSTLDVSDGVSNKGTDVDDMKNDSTGEVNDVTKVLSTDVGENLNDDIISSNDGSGDVVKLDEKPDVSKNRVIRTCSISISDLRDIVDKCKADRRTKVKDKVLLGDDVTDHVVDDFNDFNAVEGNSVVENDDFERNSLAQSDKAVCKMPQSAYDSGVGTLESVFDEDANYTDFETTNNTRRSSTDVFHAMMNDDIEELY